MRSAGEDDGRITDGDGREGGGARGVAEAGDGVQEGKGLNGQHSGSLQTQTVFQPCRSLESCLIRPWVCVGVQRLSSRKL